MRNQKKKKHSFRSYLNRRLLLIALISLLGFGHFWISSEYKDFKVDERMIRENFIEEQKAKIVFEVNNALKYIEYNQDLIEFRLQENIKNRVYEAYAIAMNIYKVNSMKSAEQIGEMIKDALRPVRYNNGRGYYFAVSMEGVEKLYPVQPQFEEQNLLKLQDEKGNFVIRDEIAIIKKSGEGFVRDYWRKPDASDEMIYPKITFVKYFEPLDWYLGTGEYLDDVAKDIQKESLERLSQIRFDESGYIFVNTFDGDALISDGNIVQEKKNLWNLTDPMGNKVIQMERDAAEKPEGGFIEYFWRKMDNDAPEKKMSFIRGFPDWQWMIGAGFHINDIEPEIVDLRINLEKSIQNNIIKILIILLSLTAFIIIIGRYSYNRIWKNFQIFLNFFKKAVDESLTIDLEKFNIEEFSMMANSANEMINKRDHALQLLKESEEKYRALFSNMQNGLAFHKIVTDEKGAAIDYIFLTVNDSFENLTGLRAKNIIGKKVTEVLPGIKKDKTQWVELYGEVALSGNKIEFESYSEALKKWFYIHAYSPQSGYFATITEDITNRKRLEAERDENRDRLGVIYKLLRHDLTNDFSVIRSAIRLFKRNADNEMLDEIDNRVGKGLKTIDIVRRQESLLNQYNDLHDVKLSKIIDVIKQQYPQIEIDLQGDCIVLANEVLNSVFDNLTSNAINHGEATKLEIVVKDDEDDCLIRFADNGIGIPDEIKGSIFDEGFIYGKSGNTGIGLFIVAKTITSYGGMISVLDNDPTGTIFEIKLQKFK